MNPNTAMPVSQRVVQVCLFLVAAIAISGGALQMYLGEPDTTPRLDNVHRFMAGIYFSTGIINFWAALTIRRQGTLVFLLALGVLFAGIGRLVLISGEPGVGKSSIASAVLAEAERRGDRVWQTPITQEGLDTLRKLLRKTARKMSADAIGLVAELPLDDTARQVLADALDS